MRDITDIVIHCSATKVSQEWSVDRIRRSHINRGFSDIGYHYYITKDGKIHNGRDIAKNGAHVKGHNLASIGVCYEGGLNEDRKGTDTRTDEQKNTMEILLMGLKLIWPKAVIKGHRDYSPDLDGDGIIEPHEFIKACPCFDAIEEFKDL